MTRPHIRAFGALCLCAMLVASCSNPQREKLRHLQRGDQYASEKRDEFAVVEYASAVKLDPKFGEARFKLAQAYERLGNLSAAFSEYVRAADALPEERQVQLKAAQVFLLTGRFEDAKARAAALLQKNPKDVDALLLHANSMAALRDPAGAVAQIEEALTVSPGNSRAKANLGAVHMLSGNAKEAEAAFRQAIALAPSSVDAKLAFASFLWASERISEAETLIKDAIATEPQHLLANRMLGVLYVTTKRLSEAEQPLKVVADVSKSAAARFELADYYASVGRTQDAIRLLVELSSDPASSAHAEANLATLDYAAGRVNEAQKRLDAVLARMPNQSAILVMKAQWLTVEGKLDDALEFARKAVAADPESAAAHFALATVYDARRETAEAIKSYTDVLRLNPRAAAAEVELSRLNLTVGNDAQALKYAEEAKVAAPANLAARVALVRSLIAAGNLSRADTEVAGLLKSAPSAAIVYALNGTVQAGRKDVVAARRSFQHALELSPDLLEALSGLTTLDLRAKNPAPAIARLEAAMARQPPSAPLLALAAKAYNSAGKPDKAETALRRAVAIDPRFAEGYRLLAELYLLQGRLDAARSEFEGIAKRDPTAVGARTLVGMLWEAQGKRDEARKSYEATVSGAADAPIAANNLAYIYAEQGTNLDVALRLATSAKQRLPDDPSVDDTLGWIYYKKDLASMAVKSLEESIKKKPDEPEVLYHLGLTYLKLGDKARARSMLERALKLDAKVGGGEAQRALSLTLR